MACLFFICFCELDYTLSLRLSDNHIRTCLFYPPDMRLREMPLDSCIKGICNSCSRLLVEQYGQVHIQATVKRVKGQ